MKLALIVVSIIAILSIAGNIFLAQELTKKFDFMKQHVANMPGHLVTWTFEGSRQTGINPGMRTIKLTGENEFSALVGFERTTSYDTGFDYYGYVKAKKSGDGQYTAVISTFLRDPTKFQFFTSIPGVTVSTTQADQALEIDVEYQPHLWQRLGLNIELTISIFLIVMFFPLIFLFLRKNKPKPNT